MNKRQKTLGALVLSLVAVMFVGGGLAAGKAGEAGAVTRANPEGARRPRCTSRTIRGGYGFISEGFAGPPTVPAELAGPLVGVGTVSFEAGGRFTLTATRSVNGVIDPQPLTLVGAYTVNEDCTLTMAFEVGFTFRAVAVEGGDEILFIETDPGTTFTVRARRI